TPSAAADAGSLSPDKGLAHASHPVAPAPKAAATTENLRTPGSLRNHADPGMIPSSSSRAAAPPAGAATGGVTGATAAVAPAAGIVPSGAGSGAGGAAGGSVR